jgi:4a-hydroxytetrahydrobiopterin dehydratase
MGDKLSSKKCTACEGGASALEDHALKTLMLQLADDWALSDNRKLISKTFTFNTYPQTIAFVNRIAHIAEQEGHHPDLAVHYGKVIVNFTTHAVNGITENDFICASKIDQI